MKLLKFSEFILESRAEILLPTLMSTDFIDKIEKIDSPISKEVISLCGKPSNFSYIATGTSNDTIEYTDSIKMDKYIRILYYLMLIILIITITIYYANPINISISIYARSVLKTSNPL